MYLLESVSLQFIEGFKGVDDSRPSVLIGDSSDKMFGERLRNRLYQILICLFTHDVENKIQKIKNTDNM